MSESRRLFGGVVLLSVAVAAVRYQQLAGDPGIYRDRMALLFDGEIPYVDFFFEHLPLAIVPMAVPWLLGGAFNPVLYTALFAVLMAVCLHIVMQLVERLGGFLGVQRSGIRWLGMAATLFPIVLFRYDPVPVVLVVVALLALVEGRDRLAMWAGVAGILTKGWPLVLGVTEWWRGRRWRAVGLGAVAAASLGLLLVVPGFGQARAFSGIHSETLLGGLFTLIRIRSGSSLALVTDAGATYVAVPGWAVVANLTLGAMILGLALRRASDGFTWDKGVRLLGAATVAILVASPLLSPQFLLWLTPFLALHPSSTVRRLAVVATSLTLLYMLGWNPGFEGDLWWVGVMNVRNVVLVGCGIASALAVAGLSTSTPPAV